MIRNLLSLILLTFFTSLVYGQNVRITGISRIAIYATLAKGTPANQIFNLPDLITEKGLKFEVKSKKKHKQENSP